jgi:hypothetical protein
MSGPYERAVTGADVQACARQAGLDVTTVARLGMLLNANDAVADIDELDLRAGPGTVGIAPARWAAVFGPLFGEFE